MIRLSLRDGFARLAAAGAVALGLGVFQSASAAVCPGQGATTVTFTLTVSINEACGTPPPPSEEFEAFGKTWSPSAFYDDDGNFVSGSGPVTFAIAPFDGQNPGQWSLNLGSYAGPVLIELFQAGAFAIFEIAEGVTSGSWTTSQVPPPGGGANQSLSHSSIWVVAAPIPLPAAAWLMFAGLGGLGLMARRRKAPDA